MEGEFWENPSLYIYFVKYLVSPCEGEKVKLEWEKNGSRERQEGIGHLPTFATQSIRLLRKVLPASAFSLRPEIASPVTSTGL